MRQGVPLIQWEIKEGSSPYLQGWVSILSLRSLFLSWLSESKSFSLTLSQNFPYIAAHVICFSVSTVHLWEKPASVFSVRSHSFFVESSKISLSLLFFRPISLRFSCEVMCCRHLTILGAFQQACSSVSTVFLYWGGQNWSSAWDAV